MVAFLKGITLKKERKIRSIFVSHLGTKGFGLVEVMVAAGLVFMIGLALSNVIVNANKQQTGI